MADETLKWRGHEIPRVEAGYYQLSTPGFFIVAWAAVEGMSHAQLAVEGVPHVSAQAKGTLLDALELAATQLTEKLDAIDQGRAALLKPAELEALKTQFASAERDTLLTRVAELEANLDKCASLVTIIDEAFGLQPVQSIDSLLAFLEQQLRADRAAFNAMRAELEAWRATEADGRELAEIGPKWTQAGEAAARRYLAAIPKPAREVTS